MHYAESDAMCVEYLLRTKKNNNPTALYAMYSPFLNYSRFHTPLQTHKCMTVGTLRPALTVVHKHLPYNCVNPPARFQFE